MHDQKPLPNSQVSARTFGGETVIVDPRDNMVRMLNGVGSRVWELADGSRTIDEIAQVLVEEYDVEFEQAHESVLQFVQELANKNLLTWH